MTSFIFALVTQVVRNPTLKKPTNDEIADLLERIADILDLEDANPFRVQAYRDGATTIRFLEESAADLARKDSLDDLIALPDIGRGLAGVISEYVSTGQSNLLQQLEAEAGPEAVFVQIPGIGKAFARRIVDQIHVETLPELEAAAHDGRLETVEGFGHRRVEGVRTALAGMLSRSARTGQRQRVEQAQASDDGDQRPSVALLLEIDAEYRKKAKAGKLKTIAPRRFNPDDEAWLPLMNITRDGWTFTVLYSNTAQAHKLRKTHDWVVIYYERNDIERQNTVVTETQGPLKGKRVVRGRAAETRAYYKND